MPVTPTIIKERKRYQHSLSGFLKASWPLIDPAPLSWNWHHDAICEHVEAVYTGQIHRLAVSMPPRHSKSTILSVAAPAWGWTRKPGIKYLCASYVGSLAIRDSQRCRELVDSDWYQDRFGHIFQWLDDQNAKARYENNKHGYRIATSVGGSATGEGGDLIIIDDPHSIQQADSDILRKETLAWFDHTMVSRLNDQQDGGIIIIGQRVHDQDLIGHVVEQGGWEYLTLPAEYEISRHTVTGIGWKDPRSYDGEPLWPEKFPPEILQKLKISLQMQWWAQYQQQPITEQGAIIKSASMLNYVDEGQTYLLHAPDGDKRILKLLCRTVVSTDLARTASQSADYTAYLVWALCPDGEALLTEIVLGRWEAPEAEKKLDTLLRQQKNLWCVLIEDIAFQASVIQRFRKMGWPVRPYHPIKDKVARAQNISVYFDMGYFFFNNVIYNFTEYKKQLLGFPRAGGDDMVDATSILLTLYERGEPMMTAIEAMSAKEMAALDQIAIDQPELAVFLSESLLE